MAGQLTSPYPPRNKGLIAGLMKGNRPLVNSFKTNMLDLPPRESWGFQSPPASVEPLLGRVQRGAENTPGLGSAVGVSGAW